MLERDYASRQVSLINDPIIEHLVNMYEIPLDAVVEAIEENHLEQCLERLSVLVVGAGPRANLRALAQDDTFRAHWQLTKQAPPKSKVVKSKRTIGERSHSTCLYPSASNCFRLISQKLQAGFSVEKSHIDFTY